MIFLEKGSGGVKDPCNTWYAWKRKDRERLVVDIMCPLCGKSFFLEKSDGTSHGVSVSGRVSPSVVCPFRCGFHSYVILKDWDLGELPEIK